MTALARWCLRRRIVVIVLWLAAFTGVAVAAGVTGSAYSNDYEVPGTESGRASALLDRAFPGQSGDSDSIVWHTDSATVRSAAVRRTMTDTLEKIAELPGVAAVRSPYGGSGAHPSDGRSGQHGRQISKDGHTAYASVLFGRSTDELDPAQVQKVVDTARHASGRGLQVELGGAGIALTEAPRAQLPEIIGLGAAAVVLFLAFGSLAATFLPIVTALAAVGTASAGITLLGHAMTVADFAPMLGMLIGLGVGIDYALFIVTRHRKGLRAGLPVDEAAVRAAAVSGRAVVFAGATVCIALLGMLILRLSFLNGVALAASLTVVLTVAAAVTLLPALLGLIGMRALVARAAKQLAEQGPRPDRPTGIAARWSGFVERHPKLLGTVAAALMLALALPAFGLHLGTSDQGNNPAKLDHPQGVRPAGGRRARRRTRERLRARIQRAADARRHPGRRQGPDRLRQAAAPSAGHARRRPGQRPRLRRQPQHRRDHRRAHQLAAVPADLRPGATPAYGRATRGPCGASTLRVHVGGITASYDDFASVIVGKLPLFIGVVIALGSVLLLLAFRSIGIPLKAALMNVAAVASSFGIVVAIFQWGWGSELLGLGSAGPIEPFLPVIMVSVLFGLSMDYQVFLVSRMYEEWQLTRNNCRAVRVGLAETSRVINSAAVIMIAVFGAFILSGDRIIAMFGIGLASAVALDAFVLRTLLVPALMHLLGGANWWLPSWLDRWLPRISIEPPPEPGTAAWLPGPQDGEKPLVGV